MTQTEYYKSSGLPKTKRNPQVIIDFLRTRGYKFVPRGYVVDHIVPLFLGGQDAAINLQIITKEAHKLKSRREQSIRQKLLSRRTAQKAPKTS